MNHGSDSHTMPRRVSSTGREAREPWRPRVAGIIGLIFGPIAAALVAFENFKRLGQTRKGANTLWITILGSVVYFAFILEFEIEQTESLGKLIVNFICPFLFPALQKTDYEKWETSNIDEPDNGWSATGWGVLGLALFVAIGIAVQITSQGGLSPYGQKLDFNWGEIYYSRHVEETEAKTLGDFLVEEGFFDGTPKSVQIAKFENTYQFRMVIKPGLEYKPEVADLANVFATVLSSTVFKGKPVEVHITDNAFRTLRVFPETALDLLEVAEQGDVNAQFNLGVMYDQGLGVPQDYAEAIRWYRMAAEQGDDYAQLNLGLMYIAGQGVAQDYAEALRWFEKGAEGGSVEGANSLAWVLATCPDDEIRDGERAIAIAKEVVEKEVSPRGLDTLAAAYAAAGRFDDAIYTQEQAIAEFRKEASNDDLDSGYLDRLQTYQSGKPWLKP